VQSAASQQSLRAKVTLGIRTMVTRRITMMGLTAMAMMMMIELRRTGLTI
jgi:hypothetical protein